MTEPFCIKQKVTKKDFKDLNLKRLIPYRGKT